MRAARTVYRSTQGVCVANQNARLPKNWSVGFANRAFLEKHLTNEERLGKDGPLFRSASLNFRAQKQESLRS